MAENDGDKTQEATPRRRQQAREEGQVAKSQDLASAIVLLIGLAALLWLGGRLVEMLARYTMNQLGGEPWRATDPQFFVTHGQHLVLALARDVLPIFAALMLAGIAANLLQSGFLFLPEKLAPDLTRLDPLQGFSRLFSLTNLVRLVMALLKMAVVAGIAYASLYGQYEKILGLTAMTTSEIASYLTQILIWTSLKIALALLLLAVLDYGFQWWRHDRDLRMTPQEVREELKNLEANPQIAARRKQVRRELALHGISSAVPRADAVLSDPAELAIAVRYDPQTMAAPIIVAKGAGAIAARIRKLAAEHDIPILERKLLVQALYREVEVDRPIPQDRYVALAEALAHAYQIKETLTLPTSPSSPPGP